ncbi:acyltransferase family protein [Kurthia massiliensis]|uniref:acyltransferase family protein n=1 Tax=Kurthia massiliensis TaxID=1033739 RepID=UPI000287CFEE|nr:acyltransferase family protein [Kurthia massiliensis]
MKQRLTWVDATKGLLMLLVVIGHYPGEMDHPWLTYIYWFHMPAFFLLSGLFFRPVQRGKSMATSIKKRILQLMIPYVFFVLIITVLRYILALSTGNVSLDYYINDLYSIVIGGRFARGCYAVIWFMTTMLTAYILFMLITRYLKWPFQLLVLAICYYIAEKESDYVIDFLGGHADLASQTIFIPWNLDVALLAVVYFAIGYYCRELLKHIHPIAYIIATMVVVWAMRGAWNETLDYHISMKFIRYNHMVLDLVIPMACIIVLLGTIQYVTKFVRLRLFEFISKHSIVIMYTHISFDKLFNNFFDYELFGYTCFSLLPALLLSWAFYRYFPYAAFFTGNIRAPRPQLFKQKWWTVP